jgi:two-component system, chemotaxis family, protein-glutamate methylesterase/glutaminase
MSKQVRVLVVDDSAAIRRYLTDLIARDVGLQVEGTAANGRLALARLASGQPDVVLLDIEMPDMDGLATLRVLRRAYPRLPVIMCSSLTHKGAAATFDALALGANDYIAKPPSIAGERGRLEFESQLLAKIHALGAPTRHRRATNGHRPRHPSEAHLVRQRATRPVEIVAIGVSTGGPNALAQLVPALDPGFPVPLVVVQHMPPLFTALLAERLARTSRIAVCEAKDGQRLFAGCVYIAPGDFHLEVGGHGNELHVRLLKGPHENSFRPAVDVMLRSLAEHVGGGALAAILTGIGRDGLRGSELVRAAGGEVIVQDEATSVVWDMPGFVAAAGLADEVLPLSAMARSITNRVMRGRSGTAEHRENDRGS